MAPTPIYNVRLQVIESALAPPPAPLPPLGAAGAKELILGNGYGPGVNGYYEQVGINFLYDPAVDYVFYPASELADYANGGAARTALAARYQGKAVLYLSNYPGGLSGPGPWAICPYRTPPDEGNQMTCAHELGHFFGLSHTHHDGWRITFDPKAAPTPEVTWNYVDQHLIAAFVKNGSVLDVANLQALAEDLCNGDTFLDEGPILIHDTPPAIQDWAPPSGSPCEVALVFTVDFTPEISHTFTLDMDRSNLMSYFGCPSTAPIPTNKFSPEQINVMRSLLTSTISGYDRRHLLGPALLWSGFSEVPGGGFTDATPAAVEFVPLVLAGAAQHQLIVLIKGQGKGALFQKSATWNGESLIWSEGWALIEGGVTNYSGALATRWDALTVYQTMTDGRIVEYTAALGPGWTEVQGHGVGGSAPAAVNFMSNVYLFVLSTTGHIWVNYQSGSPNFQPEWVEVPGNGVAQFTPAAVQFNNQLWVFVTGTSGGIFYNFANDGEPFQSAWTEVPGEGVTIAAPTVVALNEYLYVFVVGTDKRNYMNWMVEGGSFNNYWMEVPPTGATGDSLCAVAFNGMICLLGKGSDDRIYINCAVRV